MTFATVSSTVEPLIATPFTLFAMPPVRTVKAEAAAVVEESVSSYVRTTLVPFVLVAAEEKVGVDITTPPLGVRGDSAFSDREVA